MSCIFSCNTASVSQEAKDAEAVSEATLSKYFPQNLTTNLLKKEFPEVFSQLVSSTPIDITQTLLHSLSGQRVDSNATSPSSGSTSAPISPPKNVPHEDGSGIFASKSDESSVDDYSHPRENALASRKGYPCKMTRTQTLHCRSMMGHRKSAETLAHHASSFKSSRVFSLGSSSGSEIESGRQRQVRKTTFQVVSSAVMRKSTVYADVIENGGSETGAQLRRLIFEWSDENEAEKDPKRFPTSIIAKSSDIRDMPQMGLLSTKTCVLRWIVTRVLGEKVFTRRSTNNFVWDVIPRVLQGEIQFYRAIEESEKRTSVKRPSSSSSHYASARSLTEIAAMVPKVYFTKSFGSTSFPSMDTWVRRGMDAIPSYFLLMGIEEIQEPFVGAEGNTGNILEAKLTTQMARITMRGLAAWHACTWFHKDEDGRKHSLVRWITEGRPGASTLSLYYPLKLGLRPGATDVGDLDAPFSRLGPNEAFADLPIEILIRNMRWNFDEIGGRHLETLRALQIRTVSIIRTVGLVTDHPKGCGEGDEASKRRSRPQAVLHGDAHGWNMFWNTHEGADNGEGSGALDISRQFKLIDFSNVGCGRVSWEIVYFLCQSMRYGDDWSEFCELLRLYYDELVRRRPEVSLDFSFDAFKTETCLVMCLFLVHKIMKLFRSRKYSKSKEAAMRSKMKGNDEGSLKLRKELHVDRTQLEILIRRVRDALRFEKDAIDSALVSS